MTNHTLEKCLRRLRDNKQVLRLVRTETEFKTLSKPRDRLRCEKYVSVGTNCDDQQDSIPRAISVFRDTGAWQG